MVDRLSRTDMAFLAAEPATTPMHNATLEIFEPGGGFDYDGLLALFADRIAFVPRYRQRIRSVPGRLANPVWVDDDDFDLTYHVRRSALPRPGSMDQLRDLIGPDHVAPARPAPARCGRCTSSRASRAAASPCCPSRTRSSSTGSSPSTSPGAPRRGPVARATVHEEWRPRRTPQPSALVVDAVGASVRDPRRRRERRAVERRGADRVRSPGSGATARTVQPSPRSSPPCPSSAGSSTVSDPPRRLPQGPPGARRHRQRRHPGHDHRRDARLADDPRRVGARRPRLRAMVPMSVIDSELEPTSLGSQVAGHLLNLPIGESEPGGPAAPGLLRAQGAQGDRPRGRRRPDRRRRRLRADHVPRARLPGRGRPAAPWLPPGGHQRAGSAVPAVRRGRARC